MLVKQFLFSIFWNGSLRKIQNKYQFYFLSFYKWALIFWEYMPVPHTKKEKQDLTNLFSLYLTKTFRQVFIFNQKKLTGKPLEQIMPVKSFWSRVYLLISTLNMILKIMHQFTDGQWIFWKPGPNQTWLTYMIREILRM